MSEEISNEIKDSGERRKFDSGAVRDIVDGKGRCDLMPLIEISEIYELFCDQESATFLNSIGLYILTGDVDHIKKALKQFISMKNFDPSEYFLLLSKHYENGCKKYSERNWEKGIPIHSFVDSAVRHFLKVQAKYVDEPHHLAVGWNLLGLLWTTKHHPELVDLPFKENS